MRHAYSCALALALVVTGAIFTTTPALGSRSSVPFPPNGIYTCDWIAANPAAAAQARVTCDPAVFFAWRSTQAPQRPFNSVGCQYVPASGKVGYMVYAWSTYEYSHDWRFTDLTAAPGYIWHLQITPGGTDYTGGGPYYDNFEHNSLDPLDTYRWGAQNLSRTSANWQLCYS